MFYKIEVMTTLYKQSISLCKFFPTLFLFLTLHMTPLRKWSWMYKKILIVIAPTSRNSHKECVFGPHKYSECSGTIEYRDLVVELSDSIFCSHFTLIYIIAWWCSLRDFDLFDIWSYFFIWREIQKVRIIYTLEWYYINK